MAQIEIRTSVGRNKVNLFLDQIYRTCLIDPNLSPRSRKELEKTYRRGYLLVAMDGASVAGWLIRIPHTQTFQELAAGYVVESHRAKGVFSQLLQKAFELSSVSSIVTFNYSLANYLVNKAGFKKSSLWEAIKLSRGKFLLSRLSVSRLRAIKKHCQAAKPIYIIFKKQ